MIETSSLPDRGARHPAADHRSLGVVGRFPAAILRGYGGAVEALAS